MINYADYQFYNEMYKGSLSSDLFTSLIPKASREIDKYVNREIKEADIDATTQDGYKIQFVACQLVDFMKNSNNNKNISSVSIDGVSKTYKTQNETIKEKKTILDGLPHELTRYL